MDGGEIGLEEALGFGVKSFILFHAEHVPFCQFKQMSNSGIVPLSDLHQLLGMVIVSLRDPDQLPDVLIVFFHLVERSIDVAAEDVDAIGNLPDDDRQLIQLFFRGHFFSLRNLQRSTTRFE